MKEHIDRNGQIIYVRGKKMEYLGSEKNCSIGSESLDGSQMIKITKFLRDKLSPCLIYLFGSYAKECVHSESDVDIAFLSDGVQSDYQIFSAAQSLADIIKRDVHLIDLKKVSTVFQMQVVGTGKILFCENEIKRANFEMLTLKKYARLNEEREVILEGVKERGNIYG